MIGFKRSKKMRMHLGREPENEIGVVSYGRGFEVVAILMLS